MNSETPPPSAESTLQFDRAEFSGQSGPACAACNQPIANRYYENEGRFVCEGCAQQAGAVPLGTAPARFARAFAGGAAAALAGFLVYWIIAALTGYEFALVAILVGWMVGRAVSWGAHYKGGWLYQLLAVGLTYSAIAATSVPAIVGGIKAARAEAVAEATASSAKPTGADAAGADAPQQASSEVTGAQWLLLAPLIIGYAFASPFLGGASNIIGWVILAVGLYQAWKMNKRVDLTLAGPYQVGAPPAA